MRVAFVLDPKLVRVPFDASSLRASGRGLTGSEGAMFEYARGLASRGHEVSVFSSFAIERAGTGGEAFDCLGFDRWRERARDGWDAVVAGTSADPLAAVDPRVLRVVHHQCSGFSTSSPSWEPHVDFVLPLSRTHAERLAPLGELPRSRYAILPNGVDLSVFRPGPKAPGRVIWASSLDRGLHHVLSAWPRIKRRAPEAELRVFYDSYSIEKCAADFPNDPQLPRDLRELGERSRYVLAALPRLRSLGVEKVGSVSRERIAEEMRAALALAYPLDPVYFTETFGSTVLECLASQCVPVICRDDAFAELWGAHCPSVAPPFAANAARWEDALVEVLVDPSHRAEQAARGSARARDFEWSRLAADLEEFLASRGERGLERLGAEDLWSAA